MVLGLAHLLFTSTILCFSQVFSFGPSVQSEPPVSVLLRQLVRCVWGCLFFWNGKHVIKCFLKNNNKVFYSMRFSVPNIPPSILAKAALRNVPGVLPSEAVQRIASFLSSGTAALLTGAGVSVDSGVKAYRGKDGRYMNPEYKYAAAASNCEICH